MERGIRENDVKKSCSREVVFVGGTNGCLLSKAGKSFAECGDQKRLSVSEPVCSVTQRYPHYHCHRLSSDTEIPTLPLSQAVQ